MSSEVNAIAEERRKAQELKAFAEAREGVQAKAREFQADAEAQLAALKTRTIEGFKDL